MKELQNKEANLQKINSRKEQLEGMMEERTNKEIAMEEEVEFKKIVDEVCSEQQDYDQVIKRV